METKESNVGAGFGGPGSGSAGNLQAGGGITSVSGGWGSNAGSFEQAEQSQSNQAIEQQGSIPSYTAQSSTEENPVINNTGGEPPASVTSGKILMPAGTVIEEPETNPINMPAVGNTQKRRPDQGSEDIKPSVEQSVPNEAIGSSAQDDIANRKKSIQNQLAKQALSRSFSAPKRTRYTDNGRVKFPSVTSTREGKDYPTATSNETKSDTVDRVTSYDKSGSKRKEILAEQASALIDDLRSNGYPTWAIRELIEDNRQRNARGEFTDPSKDVAFEERWKGTRGNQYNAVDQLLDSGKKDFVANNLSFIMSALNGDESQRSLYEDIAEDIYEEIGPDFIMGSETFNDVVQRRLLQNELLDMERKEKKPPEKKTPEQAEEEARKEKEKEYTAISSNKDWLFENPLEIKGSVGYNSKTGRFEFSEEAMKPLNLIGSMYGLDPTNYDDFIAISTLIKYATGLGCDKEGLIFGKEYENFEMGETTLKQAAWLIASSQKMHGHPFGLSPANAQVMWGKNNRYPVGCIPSYLAEALRASENSCMHSMTASSIVDLAKKSWLESVQPTLAKHCAASGDDKMYEQWASIEHMIMATCETIGEDSNNWNVTPYPDRRLSSLANAARGFTDFMQTSDAAVVESERIQRAVERVSLKKATLEGRNDASKTADFLFTKGGSVIRGTRILLEVPLLVSAEAEHLINNTLTNAIDEIVFSRGDNGGKGYRPTEKMYKIAESNSFNETFKALSSLRDVGGWDAVEAFIASGERPTKEGIKSWIVKNTYSFKPQGKFSEKFSNFADAMNSVIESWIPGDFGFEKSDARLFIKCLMAEQCRRGGITAEDAEKMMETNPSQFLLDVFGTPVGKDAFVSSKALYAGRISPLPELLKSKLKKNGFTDFAVASVMQSWYVQYGLKAFELWLPFSNTASLAVARGMAKRNVDGSMYWTELAVGGASIDFKKAMLYDCAKLGQNTMQAMFIAAIIGACGGLQPPEDEDGDIDMEKFYLPWEWTVKFPWMDERVPVRQNWWMDDILQSSAIVAVALCFANQASDKSYPIESGFVDRFLAAGKMCWNGLTDVMGNNQVFEVGSMIFDLIGCGIDIFNYVRGEDEQLGRHISDLIDGVSGVLSPSTWVGLAAKAVNSSTPMIVSDIYPWFWSDDYARNYFENTDGTKKSSAEIAWNKYAVNNPMMAWIGNLIDPGSFGREYSNYQYRDDPTAEAWVHNNSYEQYCEKWGLNDSDDAKSAYAESKLEEIKSIGGSKNAKENGILFGYEDYKIIRSYLNDLVQAAKDNISRTNTERFNGEISNAEKYARNDYYFSMIYDIRNQLDSFQYDDLVYTGDTYIEVAGTYVQNPETGEWYNYGDKKGDNLFMPFYSPQAKTPGDDYMSGHWSTEIGNDFQTNSYLDNSDSSKSMLTSGARNLVVNNDLKKSETIQDLMDETKAITDKWDEAIAELKEQGKSSSSNYSSSYRSSRGYSVSGGYSYEPKIYSNSSALYSAKPSTMYSKTPYSTSTKYLNPTVYTSGSRDSYSRRES